MLGDVSQAITTLPDTSVLIITVDTEPPKFSKEL